MLTHWGRLTHLFVGNLTIIGPDNGLSPGRRQAIIWTNAAILLIGPWGTNFSQITIGIHTFSFKKIHLKMASAKWRPFCLGLNVLTMSWGWSTDHFDFQCHWLIVYSIFVYGLWCVLKYPGKNVYSFFHPFFFQENSLLPVLCMSEHAVICGCQTIIQTIIVTKMISNILLTDVIYITQMMSIFCL